MKPSKLQRYVSKGKEDGQLLLNQRCVALGGPNQFIKHHKECNINTTDLRKMINAGGIDDESRRFLENPNTPKN